MAINMLKDYSKVTGMTTKEGRQQFANYMIKERARGNLLGYFGYNASVFVKWGLNVGTKLGNVSDLFILFLNRYTKFVSIDEQTNY